MTSNNYVLGIDIGVGSIGWAVIDIKNQSIIDLGSYIYDSAASNHERREHRGRRSYYQNRTKRLKALRQTLKDIFQFDDMDFLDTRYAKNAPNIKHNPSQNDAILSAVHWRAVGLGKAINNISLCRAIYHIAKSRGVRLTRVIPKADDDDNKAKRKEASAIAKAVGDTRAEMESQNIKYPAQLLEQRRVNGLSVKAKKDREHNILFHRDEVKNELKALLDYQQTYHANLDDGAINNIINIVFDEKDPPKYDHLIGDCIYNPSEKRLNKASKLFQELRIYEELANITIRDSLGNPRDMGNGHADGKLTIAQRDILYNALQSQKEIKAKHIIKLLELNNFDRVSIANQGKKKIAKNTEQERAIKGNETLHALQKYINPNDYDNEALEKLIAILQNEHDTDRLNVALRQSPYNFDNKTIEGLENITLPSGYSKIGKTASQQILDIMRQQHISRYDAVQQLGLEHGKLDAQSYDTLPYYGANYFCQEYCINVESSVKHEQKYGRIANPVVHKTLNKLRLVVNEIIKKYGKPDEIAIELARELSMSQKESEDYQVAINKNKKTNEQAKEQGIKPIFKYLHTLQGGICPYSGKTICDEHIRTGAVEVDHILPYSRSYWDAKINKVLCFATENREKSNLSPYEHWGIKDPKKYEEIIVRIKDYPQSKQRLFFADAMDKIDAGEMIKSRFANDTAYAAKLAKAYLKPLLNDNQYDVRTASGGVTAYLRLLWGLNSLLHDDYKTKNRNDSRHHAIDAVVIALASVKMVQDISKSRQDFSSSREFYNKVKESIGSCEHYKEPWADFRQQLKEKIKIVKENNQQKNIVVREKAKTGSYGGLHKETNYKALAYSKKEDKYLIYKSHLLTDILNDKPTMDKIKKANNSHELADIFTNDIFKIDAKSRNDIHNRLANADLYNKSPQWQQDLAHHYQLLEQLRDNIINAFHHHDDIYINDDGDEKTYSNIDKLSHVLNNMLNQPSPSQNRNDTIPTIKRYRTLQWLSARIIGKDKRDNKHQAPHRLYTTQNNSHLNIYYNPTIREKYKIDVIQALDAIKGNDKSLDPNDEFIISLKRNDEFIINNQHDEREIMRLVKMSDDNYMFLPTYRAVNADKDKDYNQHIQSTSKLIHCNPHKIIRNALGDIIQTIKIFDRH